MPISAFLMMHILITNDGGYIAQGTRMLADLVLKHKSEQSDTQAGPYDSPTFWIDRLGEAQFEVGGPATVFFAIEQTWCQLDRYRLV